MLYVHAQSAPGGDGTPEASFATIMTAMAEAEEGSIIAIAKGYYDEAITLHPGVTLWGACVADTIVDQTFLGIEAATVTSTSGEVAIRNLQIRGAGTGIKVVGHETHVNLRELSIEGTGGIGLLVSDHAGAVIDTITIRGEREATRRGDIGALFKNGAHVTLNRGALEWNRGRGIEVRGRGASVYVSSTVVRGTIPTDYYTISMGADVTRAGTLSVRHSVFLDNQGGIYASFTGTRLSVDDSLITHTHQHHMVGFGLLVQYGPQVSIRRTAILDNEFVGAMVQGPSTDVHLEDVVIRNTRTEAIEGDSGVGLSLASGSYVHASKVAIEDNRSFGVHARGKNTSLLLSDARVSGTREDSNGHNGFGIVAMPWTNVQGERVLVESNREFGIRVEGPGAIVKLDQVTVRATQARDCDCSQGPGYGIGVYRGGHVDLSIFEIAENALCGIQIASQGDLQLQDGTVRDHIVGVSIHLDDFHLDKLTNNVVYRNNQRNLVTNALPLPLPLPLPDGSQE